MVVSPLMVRSSVSLLTQIRMATRMARRAGGRDRRERVGASPLTRVARAPKLREARAAVVSVRRGGAVAGDGELLGSVAIVSGGSQRQRALANQALENGGVVVPRSSGMKGRAPTVVGDG